MILAILILISTTLLIIGFVRNYNKLDKILITHLHADHVGGNLKLKEKVLKIKNNLKINLPTIPSVLDEELECNIFLKAEDIETFSKLRDLKDNF